ncbi:MAG: SPASM domain-containing protein [Nitrospirae bacterium]|nr:SPASM domain-containing protein [Nitrospirota bacterium]
MPRLLALGRAYAGYLRGAVRLPGLPHRFWIEPTNTCNFQCVMCPNSMEEVKRAEKGDMEWSLYTRIIDEIGGSPRDVNLFHRGESLVHPRFVEMIAYAHERGLKTRLHTNASLLDPKTAEETIRAGLDYVSFSFDGYDKPSYESARIKGKFETTIRNIVSFLEAKKRLGRGRPFAVLQVMEIGAGNGDLPARREAFRKRFEGLPLDRFTVRTPHNWGGTLDVAGKGVREDLYTVCTFPWYSMTILWDGRVLPCPQDFKAEMVLGDLTRQTVAEVWNSPETVALRTKLRDRDLGGLPLCAGCDILHRKTFLGVPSDYLKTFIADQLVR